MRHATGGKHFKGLLDHGHIVFRQKTRIGARIGQRLVPLIQALCQGQRAFGRKTKSAIGFALERGQIKQLARCLARRLGFFRYRGPLAAHRVGNAAGAQGFPQAVGALLGVWLGPGCQSRALESRVKPAPGIVARLGRKSGVNLPVIAADEFADFFFTLNHDRERRRLHPADGG